jgi:hypothetical protein
MGAGENLIEAMAEGIRNATVVLIFLSDSYVNRYGKVYLVIMII